MSGILIRTEDDDGGRDYLDGKAVRDGMTLDLLLYVRPPGHAPRFAFAIGGAWERAGGAPPLEVFLVLPREAILRWPEDR